MIRAIPSLEIDHQARPRRVILVLFSLGGYIQDGVAYIFQRSTSLGYHLKPHLYAQHINNMSTDLVGAWPGVPLCPVTNGFVLLSSFRWNARRPSQGC